MLTVLVVSLCKAVIHKLKILRGGKRIDFENSVEEARGPPCPPLPNGEGGHDF